jgi:hypothetical protein
MDPTTNPGVNPSVREWLVLPVSYTTPVMFLVKLGKHHVGDRGQNTYTWYVDQWLKYIVLLIHVVCGPMVEIYHSSYYIM